jgi:hypothetical protein
MITGDEEATGVVTPWDYQYKLLATRNFLNIVRLPQTSYVKFITTCTTATFVAFFFWQAGLTPDLANDSTTKEFSRTYT